MINRNEKGENITDMKTVHKFEKIFETVETKQEERSKAKKGPISSRIGLALMGWKPKTSAAKLIEYLEIDFELGKSAKLAPFRELFVKEPDYFVTDPRGMLTL
jgi:hypothetical protein